MGRFSGVKLTSKGLRLQAKVQTGEKLIFKGVIVGTGYLPDDADVVTMTELISPVTDAQTNIIGNKVTGDGYSQLEARITSGATAFYLREIGIIATDPDEGDILYAYTNAGDYADFIPTAVDNITTQDIILVTAIGNADEVETNITLDAEVSREEFAEFKEITEDWINRSGDDISALSEQSASKLSAAFVPELPMASVNYNFDTDTAFEAIERCTAEITENGGEKYLTIVSSSNAGNKYGLANLDFSNIAENAASMVVEMDIRLPGGRWYVGLADLSKRPGSSSGINYDSTGVVFHHGTKDGSYYYVNGVLKNTVSFSNVWLHVKTVIDFTNKTVFYEIRDKETLNLQLSGTVDFIDADVTKITGIELYTWTQTSIDIDNVNVIANYYTNENTVYLVERENHYDVYMYKKGEPQLISGGTDEAIQSAVNNSHTHLNKTILDSITDEKADQWDEAYLTDMKFLYQINLSSNELQDSVILEKPYFCIDVKANSNDPTALSLVNYCGVLTIKYVTSSAGHETYNYKFYTISNGTYEKNVVKTHNSDSTTSTSTQNGWEAV